MKYRRAVLNIEMQKIKKKVLFSLFFHFSLKTDTPYHTLQLHREVFLRMEGQNNALESCTGYTAAMNPTLFPPIPIYFSFKPQDLGANAGSSFYNVKQ